MKRLTVIYLLIIFFPPGILAQDQHYIDSLVLKLDQKLEDTSRIQLLNTIASDLYYVNSEKIFDFARQALELSEQINYKIGIAKAYNNLGIYYRTKGIYNKSIDYFFNSLYIMEDLNNMKGVARSYNLIGIIYYYLSNYELSLEYYNKALKLNIKQNDKKWIAGNCNNIGMIYESMGEYSKALEYYFKSLDSNIELKNNNWVANNYSNIGSLYQKMGNPKSLEYFFKSLEIRKKQGDIAGIANANLSIGKYYNSQLNCDSGLIYLLRSYDLADRIKSLDILSNSSNQLSISYNRLKKFEKAYYYYDIYKSLSDSLNIEKNSQKITRLEMQYQFRKDQYIEELEYQKTELFQISIAVLLFLLLIIAILFFGRQRAKSKQHELEQKQLQIEYQLLQEELLSKDKVLQDNVKYLVKKNELITTVSEKLINKAPEFKKENQKIINDIILELQSSVDSEIWKEFELRFKQVHSNFYNNLKKQFPDLSANDKKLCAFLRLNMTTREISAITNQSISSIETARSRLRKKLNISNKNIGLIKFLTQF